MMTKSTIDRLLRAKRERFSRNRAVGIWIARQCSMLLKKAGYEKAGPYVTFGNRRPGYLCSEAGNGTRAEPTATVHWVDNYHGINLTSDQRRLLDEFRRIIEDDGRFQVTPHETAPWFYVTKRRLK